MNPLRLSFPYLTEVKLQTPRSEVVYDGWKLLTFPAELIVALAGRETSYLPRCVTHVSSSNVYAYLYLSSTSRNSLTPGSFRADCVILLKSFYWGPFNMVSALYKQSLFGTGSKSSRDSQRLSEFCPIYTAGVLEPFNYTLFLHFSLWM